MTYKVYELYNFSIACIKYCVKGKFIDILWDIKVSLL